MFQLVQGKVILLTCICPNWKSIYLQCSKNMTRAKWPVSMWKLIVHGKAQFSGNYKSSGLVIYHYMSNFQINSCHYYNSHAKLETVQFGFVKEKSWYLSFGQKVVQFDQGSFAVLRAMVLKWFICATTLYLYLYIIIYI